MWAIRFLAPRRNDAKLERQSMIRGIPRKFRIKTEIVLSIALGLMPLMVGCGSNPHRIVPVRGKVAYRDGSPIKADRIVVRFVPQSSAGAKETLAAASGEVNVADGSFSGLTTHKYLDGAIVGEKKVLVQAFKKGKVAGLDLPDRAVPDKYSKAETTPLTVNVAYSGESFELLIDK